MRRHAGLTLVELLFVLALSAILLGLAAASFDSLIQRQRLRTAVVDLVAAIELTRSQAMARGGRVLLVPLADDGLSWQQGWAVFIDANGNRRPDPGETLIQRHDGVASGISIVSAFTSAAAPHYLAYNGADCPVSPAGKGVSQGDRDCGRNLGENPDHLAATFFLGAS